MQAYLHDKDEGLGVESAADLEEYLESESTMADIRELLTKVAGAGAGAGAVPSSSPKGIAAGSSGASCWAAGIMRVIIYLD